MKIKKDLLQSTAMNAKGGDEDSILKLISHYTISAKGICVKYIGKIDDDLLSECVVLLLEKLKSYDHSLKASFNTYFKNIMIGKISDYVGKNYYYKDIFTENQRNRFTKLKNIIKRGDYNDSIDSEYKKYCNILDTFKNAVVVENTYNDNTEDNIIYKETINNIKQVLSEEQFILFYRIAILGDSMSTIAIEIGISKQAVRDRYKTIKNKIKNNVILF